MRDVVKKWFFGKAEEPFFLPRPNLIMSLSFRIFDAESIFGDMLDKHAAPLGLYGWLMALSTNMSPLWGCTGG